MNAANRHFCNVWLHSTVLSPHGEEAHLWVERQHGRHERACRQGCSRGEHRQADSCLVTPSGSCRMSRKSSLAAAVLKAFSLSWLTACPSASSHCRSCMHTPALHQSHSSSSSSSNSSSSKVVHVTAHVASAQVAVPYITYCSMNITQCVLNLLV